MANSLSFFFLIEARRALEIVRTKSIYMSTTRNQYLKFENFATLLLLLSRNSCKVANFEGCMAMHLTRSSNLPNKIRQVCTPATHKNISQPFHTLP